VLDDVAVTSSAGNVVAEQTKSAITHNPLADRAVEFWKTISNWVDAVRSGSLVPAQTQFDLYVSRKLHGLISDRFEQAETREDALTIIDAACDELWGSAPKRPKRNRIGAGLKPFVENVFGADRQLVAAIIARFSIVRGRGASASEIDDLLRTKFVSEEKIDIVRDFALGWVKRRIDELIEQGHIAAILSDEFHHVMTAFVQKYDQRRILFSIAQVTHEEALAELPVRVYVRQLELIDASFDEKIRAASDFLSASADRTFWAKRGWIFDASFNDFELALKRHLEIKRKTRLLEDSFRAAEVTGQLIYADSSDCRQTLEGLEVPPHFVPGSLHTLADRRDIGWHPEFRKLLGTAQDVARP